jgi:hypothetical protein
MCFLTSATAISIYELVHCIKMQPLTRDEEVKLLRWPGTMGECLGICAKAFPQTERHVTSEQIDTVYNNLMVHAAQNDGCKLIFTGQILDLTDNVITDLSDFALSSTETAVNLFGEFQHHQHTDPGNHHSYHRYLHNGKGPAGYLKQPGGNSLFSSTLSPSDNLDWTNDRSIPTTSITYASTCPLQSTSFFVPSDNYSLPSPGQTFHNWIFDLSPRLGDASFPFVSFPPQIPKSSSTAYNGPQVNGMAYTTDLYTLPGWDSLEAPISAPKLEAGLIFSPPMNGSTSIKASIEQVLPANNESTTRQSLPSRAPLRNKRTSKSSNRLAKFACTICQRRFIRKGDWERHESSQCSPQTTWICMLRDEPAILTSAGWSCTFCNIMSLGPSPTAIFDHLEKEHRISKCLGKAVEDRSFKRKDKLKSHLRNLHGLSAASNRWEEWHQSTASAPVLEWTCGFCGIGLPTWKGEFSVPFSGILLLPN